ncbi:T-Complex Protein 1 Subunit Gamma [Manis pentadactyla]|nr:T-Complex Protein 1 Subunit Gamma [Manis pentadactyla]
MNIVVFAFRERNAMWGQEDFENVIQKCVEYYKEISSAILKIKFLNFPDFGLRKNSISDISFMDFYNIAS